MHAMPKIVLQVSYQTCKRCSEKLGYWESIQPYFCYHRWVLAYDTVFKYLARKYFPHQLSPSLNMTLLANVWSTPQGTGTLYSNYIYAYFAQAYRKGLISSTLKLPLVFNLKKVATIENFGLQCKSLTDLQRIQYGILQSEVLAIYQPSNFF